MAFPLGCVNVHPSLLPRWRGACPLMHTLIAADQVTGVSVVDLASEDDEDEVIAKRKALDTGDVLYQQSVHLARLSSPPPKTVRELSAALMPLSVAAMFQVGGFR